MSSATMQKACACANGDSMKRPVNSVKNIENARELKGCSGG